MGNLLDYMSEDERDLYVIESECDAEILKGMFLLESVSKQLEFNMKDAELKCIKESGSDEDLDIMYEAVTVDASAKKANIISKMLTAISEFIQKFLDKIKSIFTDKVVSNAKASNKTIELSEDPKAKINYYDRMMSNSISALESGKPAKEIPKPNFNKKTVLTTVAVAAIVASGIKMISGYKKDIARLTDLQDHYRDAMLKANADNKNKDAQLLSAKYELTRLNYQYNKNLKENNSLKNSHLKALDAAKNAGIDVDFKGKRLMQGLTDVAPEHLSNIKSTIQDITDMVYGLARSLNSDFNDTTVKESVDDLDALLASI